MFKDLNFRALRYISTKTEFNQKGRIISNIQAERSQRENQLVKSSHTGSSTLRLGTEFSLSTFNPDSFKLWTNHTIVVWHHTKKKKEKKNSCAEYRSLVKFSSQQETSRWFPYFVASIFYKKVIKSLLSRLVFILNICKEFIFVSATDLWW